MDRYWKSGGAGSAPAAPAASPGYPTSGNPGGGVPASRPGPWWYHMVSEEIRKVIADAGLTPDHTNLGQLSQAIALLSPTVAAGGVVAFARNTAPTGWLKANGALVNRTTYAALFAAIGTTFGVGDGSTTFGLPDLRGEFIRGWDDARGVDSGRAFGSAQADAMQGHRHPFNGLTTGSFGGGSGSITPVISAQQTGDPSTDTVNGTPRTAAETRPRNIALLVCIKF